MKTTLSIQRVALLALALGTAGVTATFADTASTTTAPTCTAGCHKHHASVLTTDEVAQLKAAHDAALALPANSALQTEEANLKAQFETLKGEGKGVATKAQWHALREQARTFHENLKAAELAIDPTLAPIFAKLEAAHTHWHHSADSSATP
jgi:hypothetical protein